MAQQVPTDSKGIRARLAQPSFVRYTIAEAILHHVLDALLAGIGVATDRLIDADIVRVIGVVV